MVYTANWGIICHLPPFRGTISTTIEKWAIPEAHSNARFAQRITDLGSSGTHPNAFFAYTVHRGNPCHFGFNDMVYKFIVVVTPLHTPTIFTCKQQNKERK